MVFRIISFGLSIEYPNSLVYLMNPFSGIKRRKIGMTAEVGDIFLCFESCVKYSDSFGG
jgi:hypothetical protein